MVIIGPAPPLRGGVAAHTAGLYAALCRGGHQVSVLSYRRLYPAALFPGSSEREDVARLGDELVDTLAPLSWLKARRRLGDYQTDLVVVQWWHPVAAPALMAALCAVETPIVVICHNLVPHESFPLSAWLARRVLSVASTVLCHSRAVATEVLRANARVAIEVCSMPMLAEPAAVIPADTERLRLRLGIDGVGPVALFLGFVREYKGLDLLLEAWSGARLAPGARLVVAGESYLGSGVLAAKVDCCANAESIVVDDRYLPQSELWQLLSIAELLVLPYHRASQSGLIPLARAAGLRIVVSDAGGLAEAADDRYSPLSVFPSGDVRALRAALEQALASGRRPPPAAGPVDPGVSYRAGWQRLTTVLEKAGHAAHWAPL